MMTPEGHHQSVRESFMNRCKQKLCDSYWREIFDKHDIDKDGFISHNELRHIIESNPITVSEDTARVMQASDTDRSGHLDFEEFKVMMKNPVFSHLFEHLYTKYVDCIVPPRDIGFQPVPSDDRENALFAALSKPEPGAPPPPGWIHTADRLFENQSYENKFKCIFWPPALCMMLLSFIQIGIFFYDFNKYVEDNYSDGPSAKMFMYNRNKREQVWRYVTYMLVHGSFMHLLENVLIQLLLGIPLGFRQRWWRVAIVYLAGVTAGSLTASVLQPEKNLVGASAGNYALFTAHIAIIIMNWSKMTRPWIQFVVFFLVAVTNMTFVVIKYDKLHTVSYTAHGGGCIAGLLVGIFVLRNLKQRTSEKLLWWSALCLYICLMMAAILIHIFWSKHFDLTQSNPCSDVPSLASCGLNTSGYLNT